MSRRRHDSSQPILEVDSTGATIKAVDTFGANGLLSRSVTGGANAFYTFDPQGSVCQRFGSGSAPTSSDAYDAYGALVSQTPSGVGDVFGFGAQYGDYTDPEDGLVLMTNRYYDPGLGRFLSRDPLGQAGGANLYGYAGNNPSSYADPLGLVSKAQYVAGGAALGGVGGGLLGAGGGPASGAAGTAIGAAYLGQTAGGLYGAADAFGTAWGCEEGGYASVWQVTKAGFSAAFNVAATALFITGTVRRAFAPTTPPPGEYLAKDAPLQVQPGIRTLEGVHVNDFNGRVEPWRAQYDEFGRLTGRTDFNAGNRAAGISPTQYHTFRYWGNPRGAPPGSGLASWGGRWEATFNHMPGGFYSP